MASSQVLISSSNRVAFSWRPKPQGSRRIAEESNQYVSCTGRRSGQYFYRWPCREFPRFLFLVKCLRTWHLLVRWFSDLIVRNRLSVAGIGWKRCLPVKIFLYPWGHLPIGEACPTCVERVLDLVVNRGRLNCTSFFSWESVTERLMAIKSYWPSFSFWRLSSIFVFISIFMLTPDNPPEIFYQFVVKSFGNTFIHVVVCRVVIATYI